MSQDGDALVAMKANAAQHPGAVASVVSDAAYAALVAAQPKTTEELNAPIKAKIASLDAKRIRPLAEGESVYLVKLNDRIAVLRAQLL